jgi:hypothetical protein
MPDAAVESTSSPVTFHSCDPGPSAVEPSKRAIEEANTLAATRAALTEVFITNNHASPDLATCSTRLLMQNARFRSMLNADTQAAFEEGVRDGAQAAAACRQDPLAGIP